MENHELKPALLSMSTVVPRYTIQALNKILKRSLSSPPRKPLKKRLDTGADAAEAIETTEMVCMPDESTAESAWPLDWVHVP